MRRLRVSAISYLNTAPLMWSFERGSRRESLRDRFELDYTLPSHCAQMLADGSADIGIIPVAAYAVVPGLIILPDVAIASRGPVRSILLVSRKPLEGIRSVALDTSSRSSAALVQILFAKHWRREVSFVPSEPYLPEMLTSCDAALLIGDPALLVDRSRYLTWDLGEEWRNFSGMPFVFAFWAIRASAADQHEVSEVAEIFRSSRDEGLEHVTDIGLEWGERIALSPPEIEQYLTHNIHYFLDAENLAGMRLFFRYAAELKILPPPPELLLGAEESNRNSTLSASF